MDLIIGAGITGLSYALLKGDSDYLILETENEIGGYCRTTRRNGFVWDYSGHFFHFRDSHIKDMVMKGLDESDIVKVDKCTHIKYGDCLIDFPFQKTFTSFRSKNLSTVLSTCSSPAATTIGRSRRCSTPSSANR